MQHYSLTLKPILLVACIGLALSACSGGNGFGITMGTVPWKTDDIEVAAREYLAGKYPIESVHVTPDFTGKTNRIAGYNAWVEVVGCTGAIDLAYDEAGMLQRENNTLKC